MKNISLKVLTNILLTFIIFIIFISVLMEYRSSIELNKARELLVANKIDLATRHYFQAMNWYAPWGSCQKSADELYKLGLEQLKKNNKKDSFQIFLRLRSGLLAARSFYVPRQDLIENINPILALLLAEMKLNLNNNREDIKKQASIYLELFQEIPKTDQSWYFITILGFLTWVCTSFLAIFRLYGNNKQTNLKNKLLQLRFISLIFVIGYVLWILGMAKA
jgi:hypothetical protein